MTGLRLSLRRIFLLSGICAVPVGIIFLVIIDPRLKLLFRCFTFVIAIAIIVVTWRRRQRLKAWFDRRSVPLRGALAGCLAWCIVATLGRTFQSNPIPLPDPFHFIVSMFTTVCGILTAPVALGGWLFLWGDNGPPHPILNNVIFNVLCGITVNAAIGAILFTIIHRIKINYAVKH